MTLAQSQAKSTDGSPTILPLDRSSFLGQGALNLRKL